MSETSFYFNKLQAITKRWNVDENSKFNKWLQYNGC
jgi:hypothetical protein